MDCDSELNPHFIKIKEKLNRDKVKLWLPPFLNESQQRNDFEFKKLAEEYSQQLSVPKDVCLQHLVELQTKALNNLKERTNFQVTGQASLKVRMPNVLGGSTVTVTTELNQSGLNLRESIGSIISVPVDRLRVICQGKFIKDELSLDAQGVKHGIHMMAIVLKEKSDSIIPKHEHHIKQLDSTKADIELLSKTKYFEVANQTGRCLKLSQEEKKALVTAMTLHEKGRAALKKEDFAFALVLLLEAEKEFCQCNSSLLKSVDNYGVLSLDIVWCYLNLQSVTQLPDAEERLRQCEESFEKSYGSNFERLTVLKGSTGSESALVMRLHLLQAIVLYHQNKIDEARAMLIKAEQELKSLEVDDGQLCYLLELGYGTTEARLALRASLGNINTAVTIIQNKRLERKTIREAEAQERKLLRMRKKLGKCVDGQWVDPGLHAALVSMGFSGELAKWALVQTNNDVNAAVNLIQDDPELSIDQKDFGNSAPSSDDKEKGKGAKTEVEGSEETEKGVVSEDSSEDSASDDFDSGDDSSPGPSSPEIKKQREEAYKRLKEDISNTEDDYLDINLVSESIFLKKYKELLQGR